MQEGFKYVTFPTKWQLIEGGDHPYNRFAHIKEHRACLRGTTVKLLKSITEGLIKLGE